MLVLVLVYIILLILKKKHLGETIGNLFTTTFCLFNGFDRHGIKEDK